MSSLLKVAQREKFHTLLFPEQCRRCDGKSNCRLCSLPQTVRYKKGEFPRDHKEIRMGMVVCNQCGGNTMNWGYDDEESCYLCDGTGWLYCRECNSNGRGKYIGKCQDCRGSGYKD